MSNEFYAEMYCFGSGFTLGDCESCIDKQRCIKAIKEFPLTLK